MRRTSLRFFAVVAVVLSGCAGDDRPAEWAYISAVLFQPSCATASCHSRGTAVAGLDFSDPDRGYASLTALTVWIPEPAGAAGEGCRPVGDRSFCPHPRPMVIAHDPGQSRVVNMLRGRGAARMPPDRPLPETDVRLVERWILDGARRHPDGPPLGGPSTGDDAGTLGPTADAGAEDGGAP